MKKIIYLGAIVALSANFSCKKSTEGNKSVIVTESQEKELNTENGKTDSSYSSSTVIKDEKGINEGAYRPLRSRRRIFSAGDV